MLVERRATGRRGTRSPRSIVWLGRSSPRRARARDVAAVAAARGARARSSPLRRRARSSGNVRCRASELTYWCHAVLEAVDISTAEPHGVRRLAADARRARVGARRRHALRLSVRPAPAHLLDRVPPRRRRRAGTARRALSTICWHRKPGWRASSPLRRATSRSTTGFTSDVSSPTWTAARR